MRLGRLGLFLAQRRRAAGPSEPRARGVESASEVGTAVFASMAAPAATGVESVSEVGTATQPYAAPNIWESTWDDSTLAVTFSVDMDGDPDDPTLKWALHADGDSPTNEEVDAGTGFLETGSDTFSGGSYSDTFTLTYDMEREFPYAISYIVSGTGGVSNVIKNTFTLPAVSAATGVESASEVGSAVFSSQSAPAATGVESASEVGTASPPATATSLTMLADLYDEANTATYTFSSQTEANVIWVHGRTASAANSAPTSVTMNGNACTKIAETNYSTDTMSFWTCADADGSSSGNLVVTFGDTQARAFARTAYVEGFDLSAASDSDFATNNDNVAGSLSVDCPAGGLIFACARLHTISGLANAEASSYEIPAAWEIFAGAQTAFSITLNNTAQNDQIGGAISLATS